MSVGISRRPGCEAVVQPCPLNLKELLRSPASDAAVVTNTTRPPAYLRIVEAFLAPIEYMQVGVSGFNFSRQHLSYVDVRCFPSLFYCSSSRRIATGAGFRIRTVLHTA